MRPLAFCALALAVLATGPAAPAAQRALPADRAPRAAMELSVTGYEPPLPPPLELRRRFDPPRERWGPGHRGIDLRADVGATVLAPGAGAVSFAGTVAGRGVVTIYHPDGLRSSLEPVSTELGVGDAVRPGDVVGVLESTAGHCAPSSCVHWGVRDGETYVDPLLLLRGGPSVLLPGP